MKIFILLLFIITTLFSKEYAIQVMQISSKNEVPLHIKKRVQELKLTYKVVKKSSKHSVILVGRFNSYAKAKKALFRVKCKVAKDAFITSYFQKPISVKKMNPPTNMDISETLLTKDDKNETIKPDCNSTIIIEKKIVKCICDKKARRKSEISDAINFYKSSSHYHFLQK